MASEARKGEGKASEVKKGKDKDKANWDLNAHEIWENVFVDEVRAGNRTGFVTQLKAELLLSQCEQTCLGFYAEVEVLIYNALVGRVSTLTVTSHLSHAWLQYVLDDLDHCLWSGADSGNNSCDYGGG
ncbi:hypothetical protein L1049_011016 [Liquidambar formosana]|uniref:Uncharacterized protein n=1 Tax=Liquidambar formosana TaxID=63359 RepID=A0AAP0RR28_LIQFO